MSEALQKKAWELGEANHHNQAVGGLLHLIHECSNDTGLTQDQGLAYIPLRAQ